MVVQRFSLVFNGFHWFFNDFHCLSIIFMHNSMIFISLAPFLMFGMGGCSKMLEMTRKLDRRPPQKFFSRNKNSWGGFRWAKHHLSATIRLPACAQQKHIKMEEFRLETPKQIFPGIKIPGDVSGPFFLSNHRFQWFSMICADFQWFFKDFHWFSMICIVSSMIFNGCS